jgi:UDP-glucose 4-epimerase
MACVVVTGGAGYVGSVVTRRLVEEGHTVRVFDDLSTGHQDAVTALATLTVGSILDQEALDIVLPGADAVIHCAAKSLVGESVSNPGLYFENNVAGSLTLLRAMVRHAVPHIVFSSTAAVYGEPAQMPITESAPTSPTNPYGASKLAVDHLISAFSFAHGLSAVSLRYFNVAGSYKGLCERHATETHLIPNMLLATDAAPLRVFGSDYDTADGTCVRDYVHIEDLANAHLSALRLTTPSEHTIINLGSGVGYSVLEVVHAAESTLQRTVPHVFAPRRDGDPVTLVASIARAHELLAWQPTRSLDEMVASAALA